MPLLKPSHLEPGDTMAAISLSSGLAAAFPHRYKAGKRQLAETFGLEVIATPNALREDEWLYAHPEARADDLHWALTNPEVKGIISIIGGYEAVRVLPYLDLKLIRAHPKVFTAFSDTTTVQLAFFKAGVTSFYSLSLLVNFAENGGIFPYTVAAVKKALFNAEPLGRLEPASAWTEEFLDWAEPNSQTQKRQLTPNSGWVWLQGKTRAQGHLLGGCAEVLEMLKGTPWWPTVEQWRGAILYLETSEEAPPPTFVEYWLRNYASQGILPELAGLWLGRPLGYTGEMKRQLYAAVKKVLAECGREDMPVVANMDFGHTSPTFAVPNGCLAAMDAVAGVEVLEAGVC